ncbi:hypothetical protein Tco_0793375 [Tanacetum coccineum]
MDVMDNLSLDHLRGPKFLVEEVSLHLNNLAVHPQVPRTTCRTSSVRPRDQDNPHDDAHPEGENSTKRHKTSENQEQINDYDFWTESYASDDDEILTKQVSQDIIEEVSLTINEPELKKITDEMLRQRCTSGDEHQYHIDQMKNFLKSDIVWKSKKETLASPYTRKDHRHLKFQRCKEVQGSLEKIVCCLFTSFLHYLEMMLISKNGTSRWVISRKCLEKQKEGVIQIQKIILSYQDVLGIWAHETQVHLRVVARSANEMHSVTALCRKGLLCLYQFSSEVQMSSSKKRAGSDALDEKNHAIEVKKQRIEDEKANVPK